MKKFAVVKFDNDTVETIPLCWITNDNTAAYWPPFKSSEHFHKMVNNAGEPDKQKWELTSVTVIKTASK